VREFSARVRFAGCSSGVLMSREGFTGQDSADAEDAIYSARKTYHRDGTVLLLLRGEDIEAAL
jgi:hypothetical protein